MSVTTTDHRAMNLSGHDFAAVSRSLGQDAWHVMNARDDALIADEIVHGAISSRFTYSFNVGGETAAGISVIGARHLASHYGGLHMRIVSSEEKRGNRFRYKTYATATTPQQIATVYDDRSAHETDYYQVLVEVTDIKKGNINQAERLEEFVGKRRDESTFPKPNAPQIAVAKAYRNCITGLVPQDVLEQFRDLCLAKGKNDDLTLSLLEQKREGIFAFAAQHSIPVDRLAVQKLGFSQITGLSQATRENVISFRLALAALGALGKAEPDTIEGTAESAQPAPAAAPKSKGPSPRKAAPPPPPAEQPTQPTQPTQQAGQPAPQAETSETVAQQQPSETVTVQDERVTTEATARSGPSPARSGRRMTPAEQPSLDDGFGSGE